MVRCLSTYGKWFFLTACTLVFACSEEHVDFATEIRPLFNKHCVSCHGGVKQSGGFGLIFRENAMVKTETGSAGIVPGYAAKSALYQRLTTTDSELRMPLHEAPLPEEDVATIKKWIDQGAHWELHWAYAPPTLPELPPVDDPWIRNEVDRFTMMRMQQNGLIPSPDEEKSKLIRRLYFDLIGLPPNESELLDFLDDRSADAFPNLVNRLLADERFGEHWASSWLDLARYADSFGYSADIARSIWQYRDWVIKSLNDDMPFDQFTIEQLAGDLLPNPTADQLIATGFHRACLTNGEGGANLEENRNMSVIDRVNTTWEAWQGVSMGCVQCHHHPYDPIKHEDFYKSFAFFNNTNDHTLREDFPILRTLGEEDNKDLEDVKSWILSQGNEKDAEMAALFLRTHEPKITPFDFKQTQNTKFYNRIGDDYLSVYDSSMVHLGHFDLSGVDQLFLHYRFHRGSEGEVVARLDGPTGELLGQTTLSKSISGFTAAPIQLETSRVGNQDVFLTFQSDDEDFEVFIEGVTVPPPIPGRELTKFNEIRTVFNNLMLAEPEVTSAIMMERPEFLSRSTHVFIRGNWMDLGAEVKTGIPGIFEPEDNPLTNRLDLAKWLVSPKNPLTARVVANRTWAQIFGKGIVTTEEDFGSMGDQPSHPDLLDWLAVQFMTTDQWQLKNLIKTIVLSSTYQQSALVTTHARENDPNNRWLSRSPRVRLTAEQVRDQALAVSGLLSNKMYGPGVMPVQPDGIWKVSFSNAKWVTSEGEDKYRRAVYTYLKRSAIYPSFLTFDAAGREVCLSRRITTNTPLQALVTLNDPVYFEAAHVMARQVLAMDQDIESKLAQAYINSIKYPPSSERLKVLVELYRETLAYYEKQKDKVFEMTGTDSAEEAALTVVCNSIMNLDEFITKS